MKKKSNFGETVFAVVCVVGIGVVVAINNLDMLSSWMVWMQSIDLDAGNGGGSLAQAVIGFVTVSAIGGTALWFRRPAEATGADGAFTEIDYSSPEWVNVKVIR